MLEFFTNTHLMHDVDVGLSVLQWGHEEDSNLKFGFRAMPACNTRRIISQVALVVLLSGHVRSMVTMMIDSFCGWACGERFFMYIDVPEGSSTTQIIRQFKNVTVLLTNSLIHLSCFIFVTLQYAFVFTAACWSAITSASLVRRRHDPRIYPNSSNPAGSIQFGRCTNWGQMNAYCGCHPRNGPNLWRKSQVHLIYYYLKHTTIFFSDPWTSP